jgi:hypothetical protein
MPALGDSADFSANSQSPSLGGRLMVFGGGTSVDRLADLQEGLADFECGIIHGADSGSTSADLFNASKRATNSSSYWIATLAKSNRVRDLLTTRHCAMSNSKNSISASIVLKYFLNVQWRQEIYLLARSFYVLCILRESFWTKT